MSNIKEFELKIVKLIDYVYLDNFISNTLIFEIKKNLPNKDLKYIYISENDDNDWKIFSNHYIDESKNILYFIKIIRSQPNYNYEILLLTLHIYIKICKKYAHIIENYTNLFGAVYIGVNKICCEEFLTYIFLAKILNLDKNIAKKMVNLVDKFMDSNDIHFDSKEKEKIISSILYY